MDVCFELLLPSKTSIDGLEYRVPTFSWGGEHHPQGDGSYFWGQFVELVETPIPSHIPRLLPRNYLNQDWVALSIRGQGLDLLEKEVRGLEVDWGGRSLEELLRVLLSQYDRWVLIFELHCDQIDSLYRLSIPDCVEKLKQSLKWEARAEGFLVIPPAC